MTGIVILRYLLLVATAAMIALHLATTTLLRRGVRAVTLLRFEMAYYIFLLAALALPVFRAVLVPTFVLSAIHAIVWIFSEFRRGDRIPARPVLVAVQIFDSAEALALLWIAFRVATAL